MTEAKNAGADSKEKKAVSVVDKPLSKGKNEVSKCSRLRASPHNALCVVNLL